MKIIKLNSASEVEIIDQAVEVLKGGGMVVYPTETVYGLGVDATNQAAVDKLLKFKGQRNLKPILIAVCDQKMAEQFVYLNEGAINLYKKFLPGPVAVVSRLLRRETTDYRLQTTVRTSEVRGKLAKGISSIDETVGIRIPGYPLILKIVKKFGKPITSTSANISGGRNPWSIEDIKETTPAGKLKLVDLILDAGQLSKNLPSTVVDTSREEMETVREGEIKLKIKNEKLKITEYVSCSPEETAKLGEKFILENRERPIVIAMTGELGAGKTVMVGGMARALGINGHIRSPSYMLAREYKIPNQENNFFYHIDAWRLSSIEELKDLGLERMLEGKNIIAIEWSDKLASILNAISKKAKLVLVEIEVLSENKRKIFIK